MSIAILPMSAEYNWNPQTVGLVQSSFFWGYLLTQVNHKCKLDSFFCSNALNYWLRVSPNVHVNMKLNNDMNWNKTFCLDNMIIKSINPKPNIRFFWGNKLISRSGYEANICYHPNKQRFTYSCINRRSPSSSPKWETSVFLFSFSVLTFISGSWQIAGGIWADTVGGKLVLGFGVIWWSVATVLTPIAAKLGLPFLLVVRAFMGIGEVGLITSSLDPKI